MVKEKEESAREEEFRRRFTDAVSAAAQARALLERFNECEAARGELKACADRAPEAARKKAELARAREAAPLEERCALLTEKKAEVEKLKAELAGLQQRIDSARARESRARQALGDEEAKSTEVGRLEREAARLNDLLPKARQLAEEQRLLTRMREESRTAESELARLREAEKSGLERRSAIESRLAAARAAAARKGEIELQLAAVNELRAKAGILEKERASCARLESRLQQLLSRRGELEAAVRLVEGRLQSLSAARIAAQSFLLARDLVAGRPCPVCGSREHPAPAETEAEPPSDEEIESLRRQIADDRNNLSQAAAEESRTAAELKAGREKAAALLEELRDKGGADGTDLVRRQADLAAAQAAASTAEEEIAVLDEEKAALEEKILAGLACETQKQEAQLAEKRDRLSQCLARIETLTRDLPEERRSADELASRAADLEQRAARDRDRMAAEKRACEEACQETIRLSEAGRAAAAALDNAAQTLQQKEIQFAAALKTASFVDLEDFLAACRDGQARVRLEEAISDHESAMRSAADRMARCEEAVRGLAKPDLRLHEDQRAEAEAAQKRHQEELEGVRAAIKNMRAAIDKVNKDAAVRQRLEDRRRVAARVAELACGQNSARVSFNTFVLAAQFDDVLVQASERLRRMTNRRYELLRAEASSDRRSEGGLDILVLDHNTGQNRPTSTLSGGEGFLASLALALGLADVVQAYSGAVRMDAMFIDEGFGSLDAEALELAYRTLFDLQSQGRLIGIISHVPELKERIDVRLEVSPQRSGSTAKFTLP